MSIHCSQYIFQYRSQYIMYIYIYMYMPLSHIVSQTIMYIDFNVE